MIMNKFVLAVLLTFSNFSLCIQQDDLGAIKITPLHSPDSKDSVAPEQKNTNQIGKLPSVKPPQWILESSMDNAPTLLKGIVFYLQSRRYGTINKLQRL